MRIEFLADKPEAISTIARWYFDQWGYLEHNNSYELTCERLAKKLNRDILPIPVIAFESNQVLGIAQLKNKEMEIFPEREYWLGGLFVDPAHRGKGIARQLCNKIIEISELKKIEELFLQTEDHNINFYLMLGWKIVEKINYKDLNVVIMVRKKTYTN